MSFKFDFQDDDIDAEIDQQQTNDYNYSAVASAANPLDEIENTIVQGGTIIAPEQVDLQALLASLKDVRFTFDIFQTPIEHVTLYRREVFDVKHQLMQEENSCSSSELEILMGDTNEDLKQFIYEGGLKSWECSIDLVDYLTSQNVQAAIPQTVVEIGCGTTLPTEHVFIEYLKKFCSAESGASCASGLKLVLTDYNKSVLRLVTVPNLIIAWAKTVYGSQWSDETIWGTELQKGLPTQEDELTLTQELITNFNEFCSKHKIEILLVSGSWCRSFQNLLHSLVKINGGNNGGTLVISSETIYQPQTLPVITETLLDLQNSFHHLPNGKQTILVAAKDIYFGVGGSIIDFTNYLDQKQSQYELIKVKAGLKRSIVIMK
ncbi:hypothetical protein ACO0QE_001182 [Hanseniaspora vineae]